MFKVKAYFGDPLTCFTIVFNYSTLFKTRVRVQIDGKVLWVYWKFEVQVGQFEYKNTVLSMVVSRQVLFVSWFHLHAWTMCSINYEYLLTLHV